MNSKDIKSKVAYFNRVVQNMNNKDIGKSININEFEELSNEIENICYQADEYFKGNDLLEWIELVENADLHTAIKSLNVDEQTLLSYIFYKEKTQSEVAEIYNVTRLAISKNISKILNKMKRLLLNE